MANCVGSSQSAGQSTHSVMLLATSSTLTVWATRDVWVATAAASEALNIVYNLLAGTMIMLIAGFMGEAGYIDATVGFVIGLLGWFYILYEIFAGDAGKQAGQASPAVQSAFGNMRLVVTIGWAIYPLGYVLGYFVMVDASGATTAAASQTSKRGV